MKTEVVTKDEQSLLLYLESCSTEKGGILDSSRMNTDDMNTLIEWHASGFIKWGRIAFHDIKEGATHWVVLSEEAWSAAHQERKARCARLYEQIAVTLLTE